MPFPSHTQYELLNAESVVTHTETEIDEPSNEYSPCLQIPTVSNHNVTVSGSFFLLPRFHHRCHESSYEKAFLRATKYDLN